MTGLFPLSGHLNVCSEIMSIFWLWNYNKVKTQAHVSERAIKLHCSYDHIPLVASSSFVIGFMHDQRRTIFSKGKFICQAVAPALLGLRHTV